MAWTALKGSPRASSHPRPLSWIVAVVGALALFLFCASWVLVSSPIGATVQGYFYSVGSSEKLDLPIDDGHSLDHVNNKPPSENLQSSSVSNEESNDSKIEQANTKTNSQSDLSESTPVNLPMTKEVKQDSAGSSSEEPVTTVGDNADVFNNSLPAQESADTANSGLPAKENSQIDSNSSKTMPLEGSNSSNDTGNTRMEEPAPVALSNQSTVVSTASNETSPSSDGSTSTAVPASTEKPESTSSAGKLVW